MEKFLFPISSKVGAKPKLRKHFPADKSLQIISTVEEHALVHSLSLSVSLSFSLFYGNTELGNNIEILMMKVTFMLIKVLLINPS